MVEILAINKDFYAKRIALFDDKQLSSYDMAVNVNSLDIVSHGWNGKSIGVAIEPEAFPEAFRFVIRVSK